MPPVIYLIRHGETAWSKSGQHTGRTDIPLTPPGEQEARRLAGRLEGVVVARVFTSPLLRARRTADLAFPSYTASVDPDLAEWDYGDFEGLRRAEILEAMPAWDLFRDGCPGGESPEEIAARADRVIARTRAAGEEVALVAHGHIGRVLAARWLGLAVSESRHFYLATASLSVLGHEHNNLDEPVIKLWNETVPGVLPSAASQG